MLDDSKDLNDFQLRNLQIMTELLKYDAVSDEILDALRENELDYFSLITKNQKLQESINIDEKTHLLKYRNDYFIDVIKTASRVYHGVVGSEFSVSFIRFDIDDFSVFNNKYGHDIGDQVLISVADIIKNLSRPTDYVIRFGGEEFDVILPSSNHTGAEIYLEKILAGVRDFEIEHEDKVLKVTVSAGATNYVHQFDSKKRLQEMDIMEIYSNLQNQADDALYESKYCGKDRYSFYEESKKDEYKRFRENYKK